MARVIGILSLKGGVGKTSAVIALGEAFSDFGNKVLLVDGNLQAPNLGLSLNIISPKITLHDVLAGKANPSQAVYHLEKLDVMPASISNKLKVNPLKLKDKIKGFKSHYDVILLDSPPSLNEAALAIINASDELFLISHSDYLSIAAALKMAKLIRQREEPLTGLIVNRVYNKKFEIPIESIEDTTEIPIMAVIPHDLNVPKSLSKFTSIVSYKPSSKAADEYKRLTASLIGKKYKSIKLHRTFRWLLPKKQDINRTIFYEQLFK